MLLGYHFTGKKLRNGATLPKVGEVLHHHGVIVPCESGLHMSVEPFDALQYAPGPILHQVVLIGEIRPHGDPIDKYVGKARKILASIDLEDFLREYAREQALSVVHLWDCPLIVKEFLETGDEKKRDEARAATLWKPAGAWNPAMAAARAAARAAASYKSWDAASYAISCAAAASYAISCAAIVPASITRAVPRKDFNNKVYAMFFPRG